MISLTLTLNQPWPWHVSVYNNICKIQRQCFYVIGDFCVLVFSFIQWQFGTRDNICDWHCCYKLIRARIPLTKSMTWDKIWIMNIFLINSWSICMHVFELIVQRFISFTFDYFCFYPYDLPIFHFFWSVD